MTEAQRVGQLFLVGLEGDPVSEAARAAADYHFGSWLLGASATAGVTGTAQLTGAVQSLASAHATDKVRFFIAANQEGGEIQALQGPGFQVMPSALAQGTLSPRTLERQAADWGRELRSAGVNLDLAPVMDVVPPGTRIDPRHLAVFSSRVMRLMLRQQMHFPGVIVSDDLGAAAAVAGIPPRSRAIDFLAAGGDLITSQTLDAAAAMDRAILGHIAVDAGFRAVVNSAVMRVLTAKQAYGLLPCARH